MAEITRPLSCKELADVIGFSERQIARWVVLGMPSHRLGKRTVVFLYDEVITWIRTQPGNRQARGDGHRGRTLKSRVVGLRKGGRAS